MTTHRYAPPVADVRDLPCEVDASAERGRFIAELSQVVANAMAHFDKLPGACAPNRGGGLTGAAQRDVARRSSNFVLIRLGSGVLVFGALVALKASFAMTASVCAALIVATALTIWRQHRSAGHQAERAVLGMPEQLRAVAAQLSDLRAALPPSHAQLAETLETIESRMARTFNGTDDALSNALLKLVGKVFGYAGFERLAQTDPATAPRLDSLKLLITRTLQARHSSTAG